jgi:tRNA dimethylallyltransferase
MVAAMVASSGSGDYPLLVIAGPTASGKSTLALHLAAALNGEIISCDSVAVYRGMDVGSAKPSAADRARIPHHCLDLYDPNHPCTAGDYARHARAALEAIRSRNRLPIVAGGTGLYLRALLEGLAPAPPRDETLRASLRAQAALPNALHQQLEQIDPGAAALIHPNDTPKLIRSLEVTLLARQPQTLQWQAGRDPLRGYSILQLGLNPPRAELYARINARAAAMFHPVPPAPGILEETAALRAAYGDDNRALTTLGYAQALSVLREEITLEAAIAAAQQGHRNYAKRQLTWFLRDAALRWLPGFGDNPRIQQEALERASALNRCA